MPLPKRKLVKMTVYVNADHFHDLVTKKSVTGIIIFLNNTPIRYFSKGKKFMETFTYGFELVVFKIAVEVVMKSLKYGSTCLVALNISMQK